jgi:hypothetical protein
MGKKMMFEGKLLSFFNFPARGHNEPGTRGWSESYFRSLFCDGNYFKVFFRLGLTLSETFLFINELRFEGENRFNYKDEKFSPSFDAPLFPGGSQGQG